MPTQIFINLPVADLPKSMDFFRGLGFDFNPDFTNAEAACMVVSDVIYAMLHTPESFRRFTPLPICDARAATEVLLCLSRDSRAAVDEMVRKAASGGGATHGDAKDHGFMYQHGFRDPDGHIWELIHLVPDAPAEN